MAEVIDIENDLECNTAIIREIYGGENAHEVFENELEQALEMGCSSIVIEPTKLGEDTARWIVIGNCLHKTAILAGFGSVVSNLTYPEKNYFSFPLATISLFCSGLYAVSWKTDPCSKYQVETDRSSIEKLPLEGLKTEHPIVLVRKDDSRRFIIQTTITIFAVAMCAFRIYKSIRHV